MGNYGGLVVDGVVRFDRAGENVSSAGDVNGDGIDDFIVSGRRIETNQGPDGAAYVIFGQAGDSFPPSISLDEIDGTNGFRVAISDYSTNAYYNYGFGSVATAAGDLNNDGVDDIFVGGMGGGYYSPGTAAGYVIFGRDTAVDGDFDQDVDISTLDEADGLTIVGENVGRVETGDFNGDGVSDLLLSSGRAGGYYGEGGYYAGSGQAGYVVFGGDSVVGDVELAALDGTDGFAIEGGDSYGGGGFYGEYGFYGFAQQSGVANLGDVNGDGFDDIGLGTTDIFIGQEDVDDGQGGTYTRYYTVVDRNAYVLFGDDETDVAVRGAAEGVRLNWDALSGSYQYDGQYGGFFYGERVEVAGIGDVNGDGFDDVLLSLPQRFLTGEDSPVAEDGDDARGVAGIIYGGPDGVDTDGSGPEDGLNETVFLASTFSNGDFANAPDVLIANSDGDYGFGGQIAAAGDVNGDGLDDFLITGNGSYFYSNQSETYLIFGQDDAAGGGLPAVLDLDNLSQPELDEIGYRIEFPLDGQQTFGNYGATVSAAGDVNGDGFDDILIGQPSAGYNFYAVASAEVVAASVTAASSLAQLEDNAGRSFVVFGGADALEAADNADGANDNTINLANLGVNVDTGELPIVVSVVNQTFFLREFEGSSGATVFEFTVQRTGDLTEEVSFDFEVTPSGFDGVEADDFVGGVLPTGTVTFVSGSPTAVVEVAVQGDTVIENTETFAFTISDASSTGSSVVNLGATQVTATVLNDDFPAGLRVFAVSGTEDGTLTYVVERSGDQSSDVSVDFIFTGAGFAQATAADIANITLDGAPTTGFGQTGTLTFAAGETTRTFTVTPLDDNLIESSEGLELTISNATATGPVEILDSDATAFINDNDFPPQILVQGGGFVSEGSTPGGTTEIVFTIVRRGETDGVTEVTYDLNPLPAQGDFFAADSNDIEGFLPSFGNVVRFEDGETSQDVVVSVNHDGIIEPRESFELRIVDVETFNGVSYDIVSSARTATILNDDGRPPVIPNGVEADVFGDPHIVTLDGLGYDFQAVGEYVLVESTIVDDPRDFQVQVRFEPLPGSDLVSVTTRMAVDVEGSRIEIDALGPDPLLIDGVPISAEDLALGTLDVNDDSFSDVFYNEDLNEFTIVLNDLNEQLMIKNMDGVLNICVFLSDEPGGHANNVQGLMGNANGDVDDDLTLRDGSQTFVDPTFEELYVTYAESWSVTTDERNFSDPEGSGDFPEGFPVAKISIDDLPADVRSAAEDAVDAAGITDPIIRESAILDFALTGDTSFIQGALGLAADPIEELDVTEAPELPLSIGVTPGVMSVVEGDGGVNTIDFAFYRLGTDDSAVTIDYVIGGDIDPATDLVAGTALTGQITIAEGADSATLSVGVVGDLTTELDESLEVTITGNDSDALVASASAATTIVTDDFAPVAVDDSFAMNEEAVLSGSVFAPNPTEADSDPDGDDLTLVSAQDSNGNAIRTDGFTAILPSDATLRLNADGTFTFNPTAFFNSTTDYDRLAEGETLTETFSYTVSDGNGGTDEAQVSINVTGTNDAPVATIDQYAVSEDDTVSGNAITDATTGAADSDAEGDAITLTRINGTLLADIDEDDTTDGTQVTVGSGGQLTIFASGAFFFDTAGAYEFLGAAGTGQLGSQLNSVTYTIEDGNGGEDTNSLRFSVTGINDDPDAVDDEGETGFETAVTLDVLANDTDVDNDADDLFVSDARSVDGDAVISDDAKSIVFTPADGLSGDAVISYTVSDGAGGSSVAQVIVNVEMPEDLAPTAGDDEFTVLEDVSTAIDILGNDADPEGADLDVTIVEGPTNGEVSFDGEEWRYLGDQDYNGSDSFTYTVSDGVNTSDLATVLITVDSVNDAPVLDAVDPVRIDENTTNVVALTASDVDSLDLGFEVVGGADGSLFTVSDTGVLSFVTAPDFETPLDVGGDNTYEVQVAVSDGDLSDDAFIFVTVDDVDEGPVFNEVIGTDGSDRLTGTDGADYFLSGAGRTDALTGLGGGDVFDFSDTVDNGAREVRRITDFDANEDTIILDGMADVSNVREARGSTYIYLEGDRDVIILQGVVDFDTDSFL